MLIQFDIDKKMERGIDCHKPDWFWDLGDRLSFLTYIIIQPIFLLIGVSGHLLCFYATLKQAKGEKAYMYQAYLSLLSTVDVISRCALYNSIQWSGMDGVSQGWYVSSYKLMFFAAHVIIPFSDGISTSVLLLAIGMAADRVFAMAKPYLYRNIDHKKHRMCALGCSLVIGLGSTFSTAFIFGVERLDASHFRVTANVTFGHSLAGAILGHTTNVVRMMGVVLLIASNLTVLHLHRKRLTKVIALTKRRLPTTEDTAEAQKRATDRALLLLTLSQSCFTAIAKISQSVFWTALYIVPNFNLCDTHVFAPIMNAVVMLCDLSDTVAVITINPKPRSIVKKWTSCFCSTT